MAGSTGVLTVRLLGPLEVSVDGRPVAVSAGRLQALLVGLAMSAGATVSVDSLAAVLWDADPPDNVRRGVQTYLARLRATLGAAWISTEPAGYRLHAVPDQVDALRFAALLDAARSAEPAAERALLTEALALWRGTPFDGIRSDWLARYEAPRLVERRLVAVERHADLGIAADDRLADLVAELDALTAQHPLREPLWVRLLIVLQRLGRPAEALDRYEVIRKRLADVLGTDPGPDLRQVYANLLAGESPRPATAPVHATVPRQLPADIGGFTGRADALAALDGLLEGRDAGPATAVVISAIAGAAGVGKTALAVHWAHRVADRFPDGQLYVNLRGFEPSGLAMEPAEAIRGLLNALGVPAEQLPPDLDAQIGLYRTLLAGRRTLVVLDNAREADQVRPLLPGSPTSLVVVTSRSQLTSLVAAAAARPLVLDLLTLDEARQLLAGRLGEERVAAEPVAVDGIIASCARLPLALAIAAARAVIEPRYPLAAVAAQLDASGSTLDTLTTGDQVMDVRAVLSWSYRALDGAAARLFRLLGLHPGADLTASAAASLAGLPPAVTRRLVAQLCRAHLLTEHRPGRYTFHDLLRAYAVELAENDPDRNGALHRLFDHYSHTAFAAAMRLVPQRDPISLPAARPDVRPVAIDDNVQAAAWFSDERAVLSAVIELAHRTGFDTHTWQLAWAVLSFLDRHGHWQELAAALRLGLDAAHRAGDLTGQAYTYRNLAVPSTRQGRYSDAAANLQRAFDLFGELGDDTNQARSLLGLAQTFGRLNRPNEALRHVEKALALYRAAGQLPGQAEALNGVAWYQAQLGEHRQAIVNCEQALVLHRETGHRRGQAATLDTLGVAYQHLGDHRSAATHYHQAIDLYRELGDAYYEADSLVHLGDTHVAAGDAEAARDTLGRALAILDEFDDRSEADAVRARLARLVTIEPDTSRR